MTGTKMLLSCFTRTITINCLVSFCWRKFHLFRVVCWSSINAWCTIYLKFKNVLHMLYFIYFYFLFLTGVQHRAATSELLLLHLLICCGVALISAPGSIMLLNWVWVAKMWKKSLWVCQPVQITVILAEALACSVSPEPSAFPTLTLPAILKPKGTCKDKWHVQISSHVL